MYGTITITFYNEGDKYTYILDVVRVLKLKVVSFLNFIIFL